MGRYCKDMRGRKGGGGRFKGVSTSQREMEEELDLVWMQVGEGGR